MLSLPRPRSCHAPLTPRTHRRNRHGPERAGACRCVPVRAGACRSGLVRAGAGQRGQGRVWRVPAGAGWCGLVRAACAGERGCAWRLRRVGGAPSACGGLRGRTGVRVAPSAGGWGGAAPGGVRPRSGGSVGSAVPPTGRRPLRADTPRHVPFPPRATAGPSGVGGHPPTRPLPAARDRGSVGGGRTPLRPLPAVGDCGAPASGRPHPGPAPRPGAAVPGSTRASATLRAHPAPPRLISAHPSPDPTGAEPGDRRHPDPAVGGAPAPGSRTGVDAGFGHAAGLTPPRPGRRPVGICVKTDHPAPEPGGRRCR